MRLRLCASGIGTLWLIGVLAVLASMPAVGKAGYRASNSSSETIPPGLSKSDWRAIRQEYECHRHAAFAVAGGYRARNSSQQWVTHFDGRGFDVRPDGAQWTWGLQLESYGRAGAQRAVRGRPRVTAELERVSYEWSEGIREWWVNDQQGLEHGFTVWERPSAAGDGLVLRLAIRGGLRPRVQEGGQGVSFVDACGRSVVNYTGLRVWDAEGQVLTSRMQLLGAALQVEVDERSARYPLTIDPIAQQAYLKPSNPRAFDAFGASVAESGDSVVVGAGREAAYVFVRNAGVWTQQADLKASNAGANDGLGGSVAVSGDTVVVGARGEDSNAIVVNGNQSDNSASNSGAVYVFVRNAGAWSQQAYLKASNIGGGFGSSVAVSGGTVVIGEIGESSNAAGVNGNQSDNSVGGAGAAYMFMRNAGVWTQQAYLKGSANRGVALSRRGSAASSGGSVAVSGNTVVVGARLTDLEADAFEAGASDVFLISSRIECTGCYFLSNNLRASVAFHATTEEASGPFSYQYRSATQTIQFARTMMAQVQFSGDTAIFSGQGTLNGPTGYEFAVTARDGGAAGAGQDSVSVVITGPNNFSYAAAGTLVGGDVVVAQ